MISQVSSFAFEEIEKNILSRPGLRVVRMALAPGEVLRIGGSLRHVRVLSGVAWISSSAKPPRAGVDLIIERGEEVEVPRHGKRTLVSSMGVEPVFFEIY